MRPLIFAVYAFSSITTSPLLISLSASANSANLRPWEIRIRASISAGPAVSKITSVAPHSALTADNPPSVVIKIIGDALPVVCRIFIKDFAPGRSRRASTNKTSKSGVSINADASAGATRT